MCLSAPLRRLAVGIALACGTPLVALGADASVSCRLSEEWLPAKVTLAGMTPPLCAAAAPSESEVRKLVKRALQPFTRTTKRKIYFYHYGWRSPRYPDGAPPGVWDDSVGLPSDSEPKDYRGPMPLNPGKDLAGEYFGRKAGGHFGTTAQHEELGLGLYAATDPIASMEYSGDNALLLRVGVPAGVGYLDERDAHRKIPLSPEDELVVNCYLRSACESDDCRGRIDGDRERNLGAGKPSFDPKNFLYSKPSKSLLQSIYRDLGIGFIAGGYGPIAYPECALDPDREFMTDAVFIDPGLRSRLEIAALTPEIEKDPPAEKRKVYAEVLEYLEAYDPAENRVCPPRSKDPTLNDEVHPPRP